MTDTPAAAPQQGPCPDPLTEVVTVEQLAERLGVKPGTIREHLSAGVPWLPAPDGRINGGAVWRRASLVGIEARKPRRGQRVTRPAPTTPIPPATPDERHTAPAPAPEDPDGGFWE